MKIEINEQSINILEYLRNKGMYKTWDETIEGIVHTLITFLYENYFNTNDKEFKKQTEELINELEKTINWERP